MNKKFASLAVLGFVFQASAMMNQRVAAKKMHELNQGQSCSYKVSRPEINQWELPARRRPAIFDCVQTDTSKKFLAFAMCAALATSAAAAYRDPNACFSDFSRPSTYKEAHLRLPELSKNLTGSPVFFDDGARCYLKPGQISAPTYWTIFLRKLKRAAKLLEQHELRDWT